MKFQLSALLFSLLPAAITAVAVAQGITECTGGSYDSCVGSRGCIQSWPESCYCENNIRTACAKYCGAEAPELQDCTAGTVKRQEDCYQECLSDKFCIQSWPQGCICANEAKTECAETCNTASPPLDDCTA